MSQRVQDETADSFMKLQRIRRSFDDVGSLGRVQMRTLKRLARDLGKLAVGVCVRELSGSGDADERSRLASTLLLELGKGEHQSAVVRALHQLLARPDSGGAGRLRALALLADLDQPVPASAGARPTAADVERSIRELSGQLTSAAGIARAGDTLTRLLPAHEMLALIDALCQQHVDGARVLIPELLLRNDVEEPVRRELKRLHAEIGNPGDTGRVPRGRPVATAMLGLHADGRRAVIAWSKLEHRTPRTFRTMQLTIDSDGLLSTGTYHADLPVGGTEYEVVGPLRRQGFQLELVNRADAAQSVIQAAQAAHRLGRSLPRAFFLGRDLLQIYDQHAAGLALDDDLTAVLDRAITLVGNQQPERARPLFERFVRHAPERADGHAGLAMCLLKLDDERGALEHWHRAVWLEPDNANHHWNLAAIAHRQKRRGSCYLALSDYLTHSRTGDDAPGDVQKRRALAQAFVDEYERIARLEYPGTDPAVVADVDGVVLRAWECARDGAWENVIAALADALARVPDHYPALTCRGSRAANWGASTKPCPSSNAPWPCDPATSRPRRPLRGCGASSRSARPSAPSAGLWPTPRMAATQWKACAPRERQAVAVRL